MEGPRGTHAATGGWTRGTRTCDNVEAAALDARLGVHGAAAVKGVRGRHGFLLVGVGGVLGWRVSGLRLCAPLMAPDLAAAGGGGGGGRGGCVCACVVWCGGVGREWGRGAWWPWRENGKGSAMPRRPREQSLTRGDHTPPPHAHPSQEREGRGGKGRGRGQGGEGQERALVLAGSVTPRFCPERRSTWPQRARLAKDFDEGVLRPSPPFRMLPAHPTTTTQPATGARRPGGPRVAASPSHPAFLPLSSTQDFVVVPRSSCPSLPPVHAQQQDRLDASLLLGTFCGGGGVWIVKCVLSVGHVCFPLPLSLHSKIITHHPPPRATPPHPPPHSFPSSSPPPPTPAAATCLASPSRTAA